MNVKDLIYLQIGFFIVLLATFFWELLSSYRRENGFKSVETPYIKCKKKHMLVFFILDFLFLLTMVLVLKNYTNIYPYLLVLEVVVRVALFHSIYAIVFNVKVFLDFIDSVHHKGIISTNIKDLLVYYLYDIQECLLFIYNIWIERENNHNRKITFYLFVLVMIYFLYNAHMHTMGLPITSLFSVFGIFFQTLLGGFLFLDGVVGSFLFITQKNIFHLENLLRFILYCVLGVLGSSILFCYSWMDLCFLISSNEYNYLKLIACFCLYLLLETVLNFILKYLSKFK